MCQPPRNSSVARPLTANMLPYSAMKKNDQRKPLYSVWNPATSSLSASARSNGARLQLAVARDEEDEERDERERVVEDVPVPEPAGLLLADRVQVQRAGDETGTSTHMARGTS